MEPFERRLSEYLGLSSDEWDELTAPVSLSDLPDISSNPSFLAIEKRLESAKINGETALVYGDYDCDGVMSATIALTALKEFGIAAKGYLPSRYLDGYGLSEDNAVRAYRAGYKIIFLVDNGVTAHQAIRKALELGLTVIILDHHEFDGVEPETPYLLHPERLKYGQEPNCAGFLAYIFYRSLFKKDDPYLLALAMTSTISDAMPLRHENRLPVRLGLKALNEGRYKEFSLLSPKGGDYTEKDLSLDLIPKINAVGRLEKGSKINRLLSYFAPGENPQKETIAKYLIETNENRKNLTKTLISSLEIDASKAAITVLIDAPEGLNGLLASRLLAEYEKPVAVFSRSSLLEGALVGSLRTPLGFDVTSFYVSSGLSFLRSGGHPQAGGCSIKEGDYEAFAAKFLETAAKTVFKAPEEKSLEIALGEVSSETYAVLRKAAPFGAGFPEPLLRIEGLEPRSFHYLKGGLYLSFPAGEGKVLSFQLGAKDFPFPRPYALLGRLKENVFHGKAELVFQAEKAL